MPVLEILTSLGFGSLLGMRHALETDHLAAVSTGEPERNRFRAAWLRLWGAPDIRWRCSSSASVVALKGRAASRRRRFFHNSAWPSCSSASGFAPSTRRRVWQRPARRGSIVTAGCSIAIGRRAPRAHRIVDARAPAASDRCNSWPGGKRRADSPRPGHAAVNRGASCLHGALRSGIRGRDGGAIRPPRVAARPPGRPSRGRAWRHVARRLSLHRARHLLGLPAAVSE